MTDLIGGWVDAVQSAEGGDDVDGFGFSREVVVGNQAEIKKRGRQAGPHQHDARRAGAAGEPDQRKMSGMTGPEDEVRKGKGRRDIERFFHAPQHGGLAREVDAVQRGRKAATDRFGKTERLVFMAGLAIADEPDDEG